MDRHKINKIRNEVEEDARKDAEQVENNNMTVMEALEAAIGAFAYLVNKELENENNNDYDI